MKIILLLTCHYLVISGRYCKTCSTSYWHSKVLRGVISLTATNNYACGYNITKVNTNHINGRILTRSA